MSFFLKLNGKVYKTTNKVTIGRGAPFEDLNDHKEISRKHCQIIKKNDNFFIKSLDENSKSFINGQELSYGTLIQVNPEDQIHLADLEMKLLTSYEKNDYIFVGRFYAPIVEMSKKSLVQKGALISLILFIILSIVSSLNGHFNIIVSLLLSVFLGYLIVVSQKITSKIFAGVDELVVNEVILGKTGLTLHYKKKTMSILFSDIDQIYLSQKRIFIHAHNEVFQLSHLKNFDQLYSHIMKLVPESSKKINPKASQVSIKEWILLYGLMGTSYLYIHYFSSTWGKDQLSIIVIFLVIIFAFFIQKFILKKTFSFENSKNIAIFKKQKILVMLLVSYLLYSNGSEYMRIVEAQKLYEKCIKGNANDCKSINFYSLMDEFGFFTKKLEKITNNICAVEPAYCEGKTDKFISIRKKRSIASENE